MGKTVFLLLAIILTLSTLNAISVVFMDHGTEYRCPLEVVSGGNCATVAESALHHITGYLESTQAIAASGVSLVLSVLLLAATLFFRTFYIPLLDTFLLQRQTILARSSSFPVFKRVLKWIALHNKRRAHLHRWAGGY